MNRRSFLKYLGLGGRNGADGECAGEDRRAGIRGRALPRLRAGAVPAGAADVVDLAGPRLIENVTDAQFNRVMVASGRMGLPRYVVTLRDRGRDGVIRYDDQWRALEGMIADETGGPRNLREHELAKLTADMADPANRGLDWMTGTVRTTRERYREVANERGWPQLPMADAVSRPGWFERWTNDKKEKG